MLLHYSSLYQQIMDGSAIPDKQITPGDLVIF